MAEIVPPEVKTISRLGGAHGCYQRFERADAAALEARPGFAIVAVVQPAHPARHGGGEELLERAARRGAFGQPALQPASSLASGWGAHQHLAVIIFVEAGIDGPERRDGGVGNLGGPGFGGLAVALQAAQRDGVDLQAQLPVPAAEDAALLLAQRRQLVIVGGPERGLTMAHQIDLAHGRLISSPTLLPAG